ncbi:MAG: dockerin type I domain-containing protein [Clostridia bacterium]|nr:dockerin type I domain-containing protein [Clostridia bacterium]
MKRLISILLCCIMILSGVPMLAQGVEDGAEAGFISGNGFLGPKAASKIGADALISRETNKEKAQELLRLRAAQPAEPDAEDSALKAGIPSDETMTELSRWLVNGKDILTETDPSFTMQGDVLYLHGKDIVITTTDGGLNSGYTVIVESSVSQIKVENSLQFDYLYVEAGAGTLEFLLEAHLNVYYQLVSERDLSFLRGENSYIVVEIGFRWRYLNYYKDLILYSPEFLYYTSSVIVFGKLEVDGMFFSVETDLVCEELEATATTLSCDGLYSEGDITLNETWATSVPYFESLYGNIGVHGSKIAMNHGIIAATGDIIVSGGSEIRQYGSVTARGVSPLGALEGDIIVSDSLLLLSQDSSYLQFLYAGSELISTNSVISSPYYYIGVSSDIKGGMISVTDVEFPQNLDASDPSVMAFRLKDNRVALYILDHDVVLQSDCLIEGSYLIPSGRKVNLNGHNITGGALYYEKKSSFTPAPPSVAREFVKMSGLSFEPNYLNYTVTSRRYGLDRIGIPMPNLYGEPANATFPYVVLSSSNKNVVYTDEETGAAYLAGAGTTTITATALDGSNRRASYRLTVELPVPATGVQVAEKSYSVDLSKGDNTFRFEYVLTPSNVTVYGAELISSDPEIATIDSDGYVTVYKAGRVTLTAKTQDGTNYSDSATLTVTGVLPEYKELYLALFLYQPAIFGDISNAVETTDPGAYPPGTFYSEGGYTVEYAESVYDSARYLAQYAEGYTQEEIDAATELLHRVYGTFKIVPPLNITALQSCISWAGRFENIAVGTDENALPSGTYYCRTEADKAEFEAALEAAKNALNAATVQNEIDMAYLALSAAGSKVYYAVARRIGDVNGNGTVDAADAAMLLRFIVRLEINFGENQRYNADADKNGELTASDAATILRAIVRLVVLQD